MKKGLIVTIATAALLAVSCGNNGGKQGKKGVDFSFEDVNAYFSSLGLDAVVSDYHSDNKEATMEYSAQFLQSDGIIEADIYDSSYEEMEAFALKLIDEGWDLEEDEFGDYDGFFGDSAAYIQIADWIFEDYPEEDNTYDCIRIYFGFLEDLEFDSFPGAVVADWYAACGIADVAVPEYPVADAEAYYVLRPVSYGVFEIQVFGSSADEMAAYVDLMEEAGWIAGPGEYAGDYMCVFGETLAACAVEDWIGFSYDCIRLEFQIMVPPLTDFPAEDVEEFYVLFDMEVPVPVFTSAQEDVTYELDDSYLFYGYLFVYANNATEDDAYNYFDLLYGEGDSWQLELYDFDTMDFQWVYEGTEYDAVLVISVDDDYVAFMFTAREHQGGGEAAEFPLDDVNAFLAEYELGFTLTAGLPEGSEGVGFTTASGASGGYHFYRVMTEGDVSAQWVSALTPILTAAQYTYDADDDYWYNAVDHQVIIGYSASDNLTYVAFWE